jgi:hypothetical protein
MHGTFAADAAPALQPDSMRLGGLRDLEDEITMLRSKVDRLQTEKKALIAANEKSAQLVSQLRAKLGQDLDNIQTLQSQMEAEIRLLAIQTGNGGLVAQQSSTLTGGTTPRKTAADAILTKMTVNQGPGVGDQFGLETPPDECHQPSHALSGIGDAAAVLPRSNNNSYSGAGVHTPSVRFERIESLYFDVYRGKGMEMLWNTLHCVFKSEFDTQQHVSTASAVATGDSTSPSGLAKRKEEQQQGNSSARTHVEAMVSQEEVSDPGHLLAYNLFKSQFYDHVVGKLSTYNTFLESLVQVTPLRSDYIANCLKAKVKPNSGVVKLLSTITSDRDVLELNLSNNYLGDNGLAPLVPLFTRLYRLQVLKLSDIGIKNAGTQLLSVALANHPSLSVLDVSKNGISRSGGKDLLTLASTLSSLRSVDLSGTSIDAALQERIRTRVALNAASSSSTSPARLPPTPSPRPNAE